MRKINLLKTKKMQKDMNVRLPITLMK